jgi:hypothetical protein
MDDERLVALSGASGVDQATLHAATLRPIFSAVIKDSPERYSVLPWILALGSRNRKRLGGLQYCPQCLASDRKPYFRIQWRLAWHTCCEIHEIRLLDKCDHCGAPLEPHRLSATDGNVAVCATCKSDLRNATVSNHSKNALKFQLSADNAVKHEGGPYGQLNLSPAEWFILSRHFVWLLRKAASGRSNGLCKMLDSLGVDTETLAQPLTGLAFEMLPVNERCVFMENAWHLMQAGPNRYLDLAKGASIGRTSLFDGRNSLPSCFDSIIQLLPDKSIDAVRKNRVVVPKQRSKQEVLRMWARLQRKMQVKAE